jgi:tetratricopeptide (TPR) repeat protein
MQLLHEKNFLPAIYELQQGIIQDQRSQQYIEPLAEAYLGSRMPTLIPQAYKLLERATLPTRESLLLKARAALELNRIDEAKTLLEQGAKLGEEDAEVFYLRYFIAKAQKNDAQAQAFKAKALSLDPKIETNVPVVSPDDLRKYSENEMRKQQEAVKQSQTATPPAKP